MGTLVLALTQVNRKRRVGLSDPVLLLGGRYLVRSSRSNLFSVFQGHSHPIERGWVLSEISSLSVWEVLLGGKVDAGYPRFDHGLR